jgi:c-di-GMP-binding flagellar brake protein YcgR
MSEQRKETRKKLMAFTPVYDYAAHALIGYVSDISLLGMKVISEHPVETGNEITLHVELPDSLTNKTDQTLLTPARIAWCRTDENLKSFMIGFAFIKLTTKQESIIQSILDRYRFG